MRTVHRLVREALHRAGARHRSPDGPRARGPASGSLHGLRELPPEAEDGYELQDPEKLFGSRGSTAPRPVAIPDRVVSLPPLAPLVVKGNYASAIGALLAGCRHVFGYPITPSTEGAELMAKLLPDLGGVFLQAVSEVATVNMMYGCGGAGLRCLTFTSSPGFSLMLEGISYMVGSEVPAVFAPAGGVSWPPLMMMSANWSGSESRPRVVTVS